MYTQILGRRRKRCGRLFKVFVPVTIHRLFDVFVTVFLRSLTYQALVFKTFPLPLCFLCVRSLDSQEKLNVFVTVVYVV